LSDDAPKPVATAASPGVEEKFSRSDHEHDLRLTPDGLTFAAITAGWLTVKGAGGVVVSVNASDELVIDGSAFSLVGHTHAHGDLTGVSANQHHNQAHVITGADHCVTGAAMLVVGLSAANTIGLLTASAAPGAASAILKTDASGNVAVQTITAVKFAITANEYLDSHSAAGYLDYAANAWHIFSIGGAGQVRIGSGVLRALATNTISLGTTSYRWSTVCSVNADLTGTLEVGGQATFNLTSTAIVCQGNITMGSGKTVDGVDISAHKHDYRQVVDNGLDDTDGVITSTWTPTGTPWWNTNYLRRSSDGVKIFLANTAFNTIGGSGYTEVSIGASKHTHYVGYSDTADTSAPV